MAPTFAELPGWSFDVRERSPCVYEVTGLDPFGRRVQSTGTDVDALLAEVRGMAEHVEAQLAAARAQRSGTGTAVYVALLNEGVDVWRPVDAEPVGDAFRIVSPRPDDEQWEFQTGDVVRCVEREQRLVAVAKV